MEQRATENLMVRIAPSLMRSVKAQARREDRPVSQLVREALRLYVKNGRSG